MAEKEKSKKPKKNAVAKSIHNRKAMPDKMEAECPILPLGKKGDVYFFISKLGEVRTVRPHQFNEYGFQSLFDGDISWLQEHFPAEPARGKEPTGCEFNIPAARGYFMELCAKKGLYDGSRPLRETGVWKHKASGQLIIHCGDEILINGKWVNAGFEEEGCIYVAAPAIGKPAGIPATTHESEEILTGFKLWNFEHKHGAEVAAGILGQALIAGALPWKAHALFHGLFGAGKSTLLEYVEAALGAACYIPKSGYTEAGLRQDMNNQARVGLLDEAENDATSTKNTQRIIKMIRQMSGGRGANIQRGTPGGTAMHFRLNSCIMLFCILPPPMEPQDLARITCLRLKPLTDKQKNGGKARVNAAIKRAGELAPKLWRRAIDRPDHFERALHTFHCHLTDNMNLSARAADQLGTILAGADILLYDYPPEDSDSIAKRVETIRQLIDEWAVNETSENEGQRCLNRLYSSPLNPGRDDNKTIGKAILEAMDADNGKWARKALLQIGLRLENYHTDRPYLLVANQHEGLRRAYRGSKWEDGWFNALRDLPGVGAAGNSLSFDGVDSRATIIPFEWLPAKK